MGATDEVGASDATLAQLRTGGCLPWVPVPIERLPASSQHQLKSAEESQPKLYATTQVLLGYESDYSHAPVVEGGRKPAGSAAQGGAAHSLRCMFPVLGHADLAVGQKV